MNKFIWMLLDQTVASTFKHYWGAQENYLAY